MSILHQHCASHVPPNEMTDLEQHFRHMAKAVFVAYRTLLNKETPVACVFVDIKKQKVLSFGCNDTNKSLNGTRHAEFLGIDTILEDHGLLGKPVETVKAFFQHVALYVTIEPCVMCALALEHIGIGKVYFGAANDRFGGNGTVIKIQQDDSYLSVGGIMRTEAIHLLRMFYTQTNDSAPVPKVKKNTDIDGKEFPPNLDFKAYLTEDQFCREFGPELTKQFYHLPNPDREILPKPQDFLLSEYISEASVKEIPHYELLYPEQEQTIQKDIEELEKLLPRVTGSGKVALLENRALCDLKRPKLED